MTKTRSFAWDPVYLYLDLEHSKDDFDASNRLLEINKCATYLEKKLSCRFMLATLKTTTYGFRTRSARELGWGAPPPTPPQHTEHMPLVDSPPAGVFPKRMPPPLPCLGRWPSPHCNSISSGSRHPLCCCICHLSFCQSHLEIEIRLSTSQAGRYRAADRGWRRD